MSELERALLWCVYVGALEGKKLRKNAHIVSNPIWIRKLVRVREQLQDCGLAL